MESLLCSLAFKSLIAACTPTTVSSLYREVENCLQRAPLEHRSCIKSNLKTKTRHFILPKKTYDSRTILDLEQSGEFWIIELNF